MKTKHTAGPWQISRSKAGKNGTSLFIWRNDEGPNSSEETNTNWACIAQHIHSEANARLIAAAPDLLAALKASQGYLTNAAIDLETGALKRTALATIYGGIKMVSEAIARAEGGDK